jgi:DNA-binding NtrC family response regulator
MDLFYRLAVTILHLPSLIERKEDIPLLVRHFVELTAARYDVPRKYPTADVLAKLLTHPWPGNVRELRNVIEGMVLLADGDMLTLDDLPPEITSPPVPSRSAAEPATARLVAESDREAIIDAISAERGNFTRAAVRLGIAKSTLYEKLKRYSIDPMSTRSGASCP